MGDRDVSIEGTTDGDSDVEIDGDSDDGVTSDVNGAGLPDGSLVGKIVGSQVGISGSQRDEGSVTVTVGVSDG